MDSLFVAISYYKKKKYEKCISECSEMLKENPFDQAPWLLKMKALTESVYVDDIENEEETIADEVLDDNFIAESARPGTSLRSIKNEITSRPKTEMGEPVSGVVRTNLRSSHSRSIEQTIKSARRIRSTRPITSQTGRFVRLGTASMLSDEGGPFIEITKINLVKHAAQISGKYLFNYLFYHENNIQKALQLATEAAKATEWTDWWWMVQLGKSYYLLNLLREAEQNFRGALKLHVNVEVFLRLIRLYRKMDQPMSALDVCNKALEIFAEEVTFNVEAARLYEALSNVTASIAFYRNVMLKDASNVEAIACIGLQYFYTDQPDIAVRFYKRLLQMGLINAEVFNNIGLCCFYSQNYDVALSCFKRALALADSQNKATVWYNLSHVAIGIGDLNLGRVCLRLCLSFDGNHSAALNNLAVLESRRNKLSHAKSFFKAATRQAPLSFEPHFNYAKLTFQCGDLHTSYKSVEKALENFPTHYHSAQLFQKLCKHFMQIH